MTSSTQLEDLCTPPWFTGIGLGVQARGPAPVGRPSRDDRDGHASRRPCYCGDGDGIGDGDESGDGGGEASRTLRCLMIAVWLACAAFT